MVLLFCQWALLSTRHSKQHFCWCLITAQLCKKKKKKERKEKKLQYCIHFLFYRLGTTQTLHQGLHSVSFTWATSGAVRSVLQAQVPMPFLMATCRNRSPCSRATIHNNNLLSSKEQVHKKQSAHNLLHFSKHIKDLF